VLCQHWFTTDPFSAFEQSYSELVCLDHQGNPVNRVNFWEQEREEMYVLTKASEITKGVWVSFLSGWPSKGLRIRKPLQKGGGVFWDKKGGFCFFFFFFFFFFIWRGFTSPQLGNTQDVPLSSDDELANPHRISICIETHDLADMPLPSTLTLARVTLNDLPKDQLPEELIHLDCYSSGSALTSVSAFDVFYSQLAHLLEFIDEQVTQGRRILIHCADGYTETSMLALSWVMYKEKLRLPGAYLHLQELRSFFVYSSDVEILKRVEKKILEPADSREPPHKRKREETTGQEEIEQLSIGGATASPQGMYNRKPSMETNDIDLVKKTPVMVDDEEDDEVDLVSSEDEPEDRTAATADRRQLFDDTYMSQVPKHLVSTSAMETEHYDDVDEVIPILDAHRTAQGGGTSSLESEPDEIKAQYPWFYSERFEGSFPSRILPFLYLGNLNHATNPKVLKALGITHVLSVGENANLGDDFKLLLLDNLYDDGIDSLWGHIDDCIKHIGKLGQNRWLGQSLKISSLFIVSFPLADEARLQGTKCLIHCRVGVSRSATITICYVMKHMHMSLVQAYLFVRARRLNVIIQPNLKFMYELLQYEQRLLGKAQIFWQILSKEIHSLNMCYRET
jgi:protein-tyrosine phosphatase